MPTAIKIEAKIPLVLELSPILVKLLAKDQNGNIEIHPSDGNPIGNRYPQICYDYVIENAEEKLPAEHASIGFYVWVEKTDKNPRTTASKIMDEIENILNKRPQQLCEVNSPSNYGLYVAKCLRTQREFRYSNQFEKYCGFMNFSLVVSAKDEDYQSRYGTEDEWP
jgi:hypothetical protein